MLREGFELVRQKKLEVTDDVSIIEALGRPVKVTQGSYTNIKVCTKMQTAFCPLQAGRAQQSLPCCDYAACLLLFSTKVTKCCIPQYQSVTSGCRFTHTVLYAGDYSRWYAGGRRFFDEQGCWGHPRGKAVWSEWSLCCIRSIDERIALHIAISC